MIEISALSFLHGKQILVVEDEYFLADEMARSIIKAGAFVVGPFAYASEALLVLEEQKVDLAVLDVRVQDGLSYPVAEWLRSRAIPFIFATGQESGNEPAEWRNAPWLHKPYHRADLIFQMVLSIST